MLNNPNNQNDLDVDNSSDQRNSHTAHLGAKSKQRDEQLRSAKMPVASMWESVLHNQTGQLQDYDDDQTRTTRKKHCSWVLPGGDLTDDIVERILEKQREKYQKQ